MAFHGQVALVTGGASGMGRVAARKLAQTGAHVAIMDVNETGMAETAQGFDNIHLYPGDVSDGNRVNEIIHQIESAYGPIDRVVHAAGIMPGALLVDETMEQAHRIIDINLRGTLNILLNLLPKMVQRGSGDFIAFGSTAGYIPAPPLGVYCASKAAVNSLIENAYWENLNSGVRIILATPPPVDTPLLDQVPPNAKGVKMMRNQNRLLTPEEMIDAIERDLEKGRPISPGSTFSRLVMLGRRLMPTWWWKIVLKSEGML